MRITRPADIERESMAVIERELAERGITIPAENRAVVLRVIHTTADFDLAENLRFTEGAVKRGAAALRNAVIVPDTNMARAGINHAALSAMDAESRCYMAEPEVAEEAKRRGLTRAAVSVERALREHPGAIFAAGNAPTALLKLSELMDGGARPALVIAAPVGFVNVVESKERVFAVCERLGVPCIAAMGRKGGSAVAAAICNALLYGAAGLSNPERRL